ncbi:hypothetical protein OG874_40615 [Nocardia sp. NBC_00565]|uniref:hypothetical protein n=1 Tax=Nocardia sp. NBC_00565 TaxID=2975993 RepID=UPI002E8225C9|nr:hypothetical protein [Nocardia sp. NBC_00565]WUC02930.1 hypothetical protein OG874_40615 [Nocardia sp. NBC_00565]
MTVRVGAVHLGWDVVSVAAGGGGTPIRPVQVEGTYTPPAYLLADSSGRLHTAGVERQRPDLGMAIADVRDILGHPQIVVAGATWPAELVFRARMYNPLAAIGEYLRGKPDLVALPFPDGWPDEKVDVYVELVERLDVTVEPLPESVALSGYVRALGLVRSPDERNPRGIGATGVYSDGRTMLVVAVHGDDEQPTESVDVPVSAEAMRDARSADNVVIEVMAAARSIGADTSTVLLSGNVCFNDALRLAFQNHLGHRLHVADHPMHALVLGASHLLVTDNENGEPESAGRHAEPASQPVSRERPVESARHQVESAQAQALSAQRQVEAAQALSAQRQAEVSQGADVPQVPGRPEQVRPEQEQGRSEAAQSHSPVVQYGPGYPTVQPSAEPTGEEPTTRVGRESLPPNLAELGSRFTRPPGQYPQDQRTTVIGRQPGAAPQSQPPPQGPPNQQGPGPQGPVPPLGPRGPYQPPSGSEGQWREGPRESDEDEDKPRKGKRWGKLFGAQAVAGAAAMAAMAMPAGGDRVELAASIGVTPVSCPLTPYVTNEQRAGIAAARGYDSVLAGITEDFGYDASGAECAQPSIDVPRYVVPGPPGAIDHGPPIEI